MQYIYIIYHSVKGFRNIVDAERMTYKNSFFFNMYNFFKNLIMLTCILEITQAQKQMTFYRMGGLSFSGKTIGFKEVELAADCLGACLQMVNCASFNAYMIKDGKAFKCEFLANNPCGFVEKTPKSSIFFQHKICKFQLKNESNCVIKNRGSWLKVSEKDSGDCLNITSDISGTCLKVNNRLVHTERYGDSEIQWFKLNDNAENNCLLVQLIGTANQFQLKVTQTNTCVGISQYQGSGYIWLTLGKCDAYMPLYFAIP